MPGNPRRQRTGPATAVVLTQSEGTARCAADAMERHHLATREAARALAPLAQDGSWLVTHPHDPAVDRWLAFPDAWRPGDLPLASNQVIFPRVQSSEVVAP